MGKLKRPGRNVKCPCGSGRKYKHCHANDKSTSGYWVFTDKPGVTFGPASIKANYVSAEDTPIPQWFLSLARRAAQDASRPDATNYDSLQALVWAAMASEALANRLLEPLVPSAEWETVERKKTTSEKWVLVGQKVGATPPLKLGEQPIQGIRELMNYRNDIMHYKHGRNLERFEGAQIELPWTGSGFDFDAKSILSQPIRQTTKSNMRDILEPKRASKYIDPLLATLSRIAPRYPPDDFGIGKEICESLGLGWSPLGISPDAGGEVGE